MTDNDENQGNTRRDDTSSDVQSDWRQGQNSTSDDQSNPSGEAPEIGEDDSVDTGVGL